MSGQMQRAADNAGIIDALQAVAGLVPVEYDAVIVNYTDATKGSISSVVYKSGGVAGTTVRTIAVTYPSATQETYSAS